MIHHVTYEVDKRLIAQELDFWAIVGFAPAAFGPRRRSRRQPVIHWLIGGDHGHAIELLPVETPRVWHLGHVALSVPQRRWEITTDGLERCGFLVEDASDKYGGKFGQHAYAKSPTGHVIELFTNRMALKWGPPLED